MHSMRIGDAETPKTRRHVLETWTKANAFPNDVILSRRVRNSEQARVRRHGGLRRLRVAPGDGAPANESLTPTKVPEMELLVERIAKITGTTRQYTKLKPTRLEKKCA